MPGSPRRIYRYLTNAQLQALSDSAYERTLNGTFTNLSGAGKSSSQEFADPNDILFEVNAELQARGTAPFPAPTKVYQNFGNQPWPTTQTQA